MLYITKQHMTWCNKICLLLRHIYYFIKTDAKARFLVFIEAISHKFKGMQFSHIDCALLFFIFALILHTLIFSDPLGSIHLPNSVHWA